MLKKIIYSIVSLFLIFIFLGKIGVFDSSVIKIDNFVIKKPFFYRNVSEKIEFKLGDDAFVDFMFLSEYTNKGAIYTIRKVVDRNHFRFRIKHSLKMNTISLSNCYVRTRNTAIKDTDNFEIFIKDIDVYRYPYSASFSEINEEREQETLKQICGKDKIIRIK